ncbi:hypothetical protein FIBSPDRAFT_932376 [Athelia psychrophila]|uniref:Ubiquitin-like domain-containing protein n=1 Tax=Athelia psychrophila TaxID=1759441 RepID=A0A166IZX8_9AGAM|nr:hypothetical protein FIBSPDRAFT_932376 [Fibularhizoctonia sp. CBS 109695]
MSIIREGHEYVVAGGRPFFETSRTVLESLRHSSRRSDGKSSVRDRTRRMQPSHWGVGSARHTTRSRGNINAVEWLTGAAPVRRSLHEESSGRLHLMRHLLDSTGSVMRRASRGLLRSGSDLAVRPLRTLIFLMAEDAAARSSRVRLSLGPPVLVLASADVIMDLGEHSEYAPFAAPECDRRILEGVEKRGQIDSDMPLAANDVLHVVPPSNVPNIALELVREDRDEVVAPLEMRDDNAISEDSLEGQEVLVDGEYRCQIVSSTPVGMNILRESVSAPFAIGILVSIDDRIEGTEGNCIGVTVRLDQTLGSFKELQLNKQPFHCAEHSLILDGRELKDDEQTLGDLGFVEGCTVHAVAAVQFSVATLAGEKYEFFLKPTARISDIRRQLCEVDAGDEDDYAFSLDGVHTLRESHTLWNLNIYSGATFILKEHRQITLSIQYFGLPSSFNERLGRKLDNKISIDDSASLDDLKAQILSMVPSSAEGALQPPNQVDVSHQGTPLRGTRTIREERLEGGGMVNITWMPLEQRILEELEERGQMGRDISRLAGFLTTTLPI